MVSVAVTSSDLERVDIVGQIAITLERFDLNLAR